MQTIRQKFNQDGFELEQLQRSGLVCLYQKTHPLQSKPTYEVIVLRIKPPTTIKDTHLPEREAYPASCEWGERGWTYSDFASAEQRFNRLTTSPA